ncbi:hypothetical protein BH686_03510 [Rhodococcus erythropolis]|nr:hypothetical protein BH686_03510 [Rhodococcus erythropolis]
MERDVQKTSSSEYTKNQSARTREPRRNIAEFVDAEQDSVGFAERVWGRISDRVGITPQYGYCLPIGSDRYRLDAVCDAGAAIGENADDVAGSDFVGGDSPSEGQRPSLDLGGHRTRGEHEGSDAEDDPGGKKSQREDTADRAHREQCFSDSIRQMRHCRAAGFGVS